ncbi:MAG: phage tail protein [Magnetococcales bacterium]|nr:phage tail protein [Magnetococcales bacterium]
MPEPFFCEIKMFAGNFAPRGWSICDGKLLDIAQHNELFSLIRTTYGGDGITNFRLPDMRGRAPLHQGQSPYLSDHNLGMMSGVEWVTLHSSELPSHNHNLMASQDEADSADPTGRVLADNPAPFYTANKPDTDLYDLTISSTGDGERHYNMQPSLPITFIIAIAGEYPSRS